MSEHVIAVLALDGVVGFDLSIPCQVFGTAKLADGSHPYLVRVCGPRPAVSATAGGISYYEILVPYDLSVAAEADTVIVPGLDVTSQVPPEVLDLLRGSQARIVSICTGARVLAEAGLLAGKRATTHWRAAPELARRHPDVLVDAKALFTGDGRIYTSAGVAAGLDLCLHLIGRDHGAAAAATAASMVVMAPTREGGQAQFIADAQPPDDSGSLAETLTWIQANAGEPLTVADIARHAALSVRTLTRRFRERLGTSPQNWLLQQRLHLARKLLETTDLPIPQIAERAGYGSANALRAHFARDLATSPQRYRHGFQHQG
ncbi:GlxA family transcriptional regulator [Actinocrispum wychmicini]|uniref:Transcriptional regulator GlxA family with amidase domain n=1 Tax=Actinocrispum wychmicini TaxID=1213861 RepID=A0A4R2JNP6_9PSEU|nr:helix-turn-helix domain-containing protein [Actinocrispum wychmicini]TCO60597.1 transcriptional regulator GlxA family with amidase domain [Actinocrispum wychmicini]